MSGQQNYFNYVVGFIKCSEKSDHYKLKVPITSSSSTIRLELIHINLLSTTTEVDNLSEDYFSVIWCWYTSSSPLNCSIIRRISALLCVTFPFLSCYLKICFFFRLIIFSQYFCDFIVYLFYLFVSILP